MASQNTSQLLVEVLILSSWTIVTRTIAKVNSVTHISALKESNTSPNKLEAILLAPQNSELRKSRYSKLYLSELFSQYFLIYDTIHVL